MGLFNYALQYEDGYDWYEDIEKPTDNPEEGEKPKSTQTTTIVMAEVVVW